MNNNSLLIHSLNINGLSQKVKKVKDFIKMNKIDILLLQETHVCDLLLLTEFFKEHDLEIVINKVYHQHNNFNGTAFIFSKSVSLNYDIDVKVLQENRLQRAVLTNSVNGNIVLYNAYFKSGSGSYVIQQRCKTIALMSEPG